MKVYVLTYTLGMGDEVVEGAYSTLELANEAAMDVLLDNSNVIETCVHEFELDE